MDGTTRLVIELPPVAPDQAAWLIEIFEQMIAQLWGLHGDLLTEYLDQDKNAGQLTTQNADFPF